jgi:hypothetical protein
MHHLRGFFQLCVWVAAHGLVGTPHLLGASFWLQEDAGWLKPPVDRLLDQLINVRCPSSGGFWIQGIQLVCSCSVLVTVTEALPWQVTASRQVGIVDVFAAVED